jgi:hypothetical protein
LRARPLVAKQEAFEESIRLKNQFRALDEDEVEFLDSVLESTRAEEERVRRETAQGLEAFRRQQEEADKRLLTQAAGAGSDAGAAGLVEEQEEWVAGSARKRKRRAGEKEGLVKGVKLRKSSTSGPAAAVSATEKPPPLSAESKMSKDSGATAADVKSATAVEVTSRKQAQPSKPVASSLSPTTKVTAAPTTKGGLGLVDYGSDEDDD